MSSVKEICKRERFRIFFSLGNNHDIGTLSLELERKLSENDEKNVTFKRGFHFFLVLAPFTTS